MAMGERLAYSSLATGGLKSQRFAARPTSWLPPGAD